jgi:MSHA biogenesis protein MshO
MTARHRIAGPARSRGLTLIELAVTIALVGILAVMVVQFVYPVRAYIDVSRRAALADTADVALRRIRRDLRLALPNSVRVTTASGVVYLEFLLVRVGGRYRYEAAGSSASGCPTGAGASVAEDLLQFGASDNCFKTIGNLYSPSANISQIVNNSDYVVVFNLQPGTDKADAYQQTTGAGNCGSACNKVQITGRANLTNEDRIEFSGGNTFTYESPGRRFYVVEGAVTYACDKAAGTLTRYWGYTIAGTQPTPPSPPVGNTALLANNVSDCLITYDNVVSAANMGAGLVSMWLQLRATASDGTAENVNLYHAVHVNNVP